MRFGEVIAKIIRVPFFYSQCSNCSVCSAHRSSMYIFEQNSHICEVSIILHTLIERTCEDNSSGIKITSQLARRDGNINHWQAI